MMLTILASVLGVVLILSFMIPILYSCKAESSHRSPDYDERQILARNRSYKLGFIVMAACNLVCLFVPIIAEEYGYSGPWWALTAALFVISLFAGCNTFAISAILQDAYVSLHDKASRYYLCSTLVGVIWILQGVYSLHTGDALFVAMFPFTVGADFILISLIGFIHTRRHAHDNDEDDGSEDE